MCYFKTRIKLLILWCPGRWCDILALYIHDSDTDTDEWIFTVTLAFYRDLFFHTLALLQGRYDHLNWNLSLSCSDSSLTHLLPLLTFVLTYVPLVCSSWPRYLWFALIHSIAVLFKLCSCVWKSSAQISQTQNRKKRGTGLGIKRQKHPGISPYSRIPRGWNITCEPFLLL